MQVNTETSWLYSQDVTERRQAVINENIADVSTPGFQPREVLDQESLATTSQVGSDLNQAQQGTEGQTPYVTEGPSGNMHDAAFALRQAEISVQIALAVRHDLVQAYEELMRTPV